MPTNPRTTLPIEQIGNSILLIRGQRVLLDSTLAALYEVETSALNQAVKRNRNRFPVDFMFQLSKEEAETLKCQICIPSSASRIGQVAHGGRRSLPHAFTEQGVSMLSGVLNSNRAVHVNIEIMRAFVRLRQLLASNTELARKLATLEQKYDAQFKVVFDAIRALMAPPEPVLWLNQQGLDICCVRLQPYLYQEKVLLDVQQVIPLPQAQEYQVQIRDKVIAERTARSQYRDFTKYDVTVGQQTFERQPKRRALFHIVKFLCEQGVEPEAIAKLVNWRGNVFRVVPGTLQSAALKAALMRQQQEEGYSPNAARFFVEDDELIHAKGHTYALTKMWGSRTEEAMALLQKTYPDFPIAYTAHEN